MISVKPEMAYPTFASSTYTFSPNKWPVMDEAGFSFSRFEANARTSGGVFIRQVSPVTERTLTIRYRLISTADRDAFAAPDLTGFFYLAGGGNFEYRHIDGTIHSARFLSKTVEPTPAGFDRWNLSPITLLLES